MRNLKKFLALVLAMLMIVSASATVSAFTDVDKDNQYADAIADLVEKEIVNGVGDDKFDPTAGVERFQMALMMARTLNPTETNWQDGMNIFTDVNEWYGAIAYAYMNNIVTGIGGGKFDPHAGIKYQDALIMAVRALGYKVDVTGDPYWLAAYNQAQALGLTENVSVFKGEQALNRAECAQIIYNMLYATPADGGATIAAKNFGVATADNTTTFVITATPKQAYADSFKAAEAGYVGVQALVNGLPSGDVTYYPVEVLGIEAADIENYFSYAVEFVNFDAKTGMFDKAILGEDPTVVFNADVTKNSDVKITYDGTAYYPVEQITGAALKNELVIFNGGELASAAKMLLTNKDGNIVDYNGNILATFAYETATGAKYYVDKSVTSGTKVITEAAALAKFGVEIDDGTYTKYATLNAVTLAGIGNYQLSMFDDDHDGKFERAIVTPVYVSVYNNPDSGKVNFSSPMRGIKDVTYTETVTKGQVFTYTYNSQTKVVTVLDIIAPESSTLNKINTTKNNGDNNYSVVLTIGDTDYTLGNATREGKGLTGANLYYGKDEARVDAAFDKIASDAKRLDYLYDSAANAWTTLTVGSPIMFYAVGNTIITAKTYSIEESYNRVVLKEVTSYDADAVYANLYMNGKLVKDVAISKINGKTLSGLNVFQLSTLLGDKDLFAAGNIFRAVKLADGSYQLSEYMNKAQADTVCAKFGITKLTTTDKPIIVFDSGIADSQIISNVTSPISTRGLILRTSSTTVFYFINAKGEVATYVGAPTKSTLDLSKVTVYADKIGYGDASTNGVASFVVVYYDEISAIKGFGVANVENSTVFVVYNDSKVTSYNVASAAELGLTDSEYVGKYFKSYTVDGLAIDLGTGKKVNTIYEEVGSSVKVVAGGFYNLDANGVVKSVATVNYANLSAADFVQNRYYQAIAGVFGTNVVNSVYFTKNSAIDVKTKFADVASGTYKVAYINNYEDGSFVGVVMTTAAPVPPVAGQVTIVANAKYYTTGAVNAANFSTNEVTDGKLTGALTITDAAFTTWNANATGKKVSFVNTSGNVAVTYTLVPKTTSGTTTTSGITVNGVAMDPNDYVFTASADSNGLLNVTLCKVKAVAASSDALSAGVYVLTIKNSVNTDTYEISFIVK